MINNDSRTEHNGFRLGQQMTGRYNQAYDFTGEIVRLCSSKAIVRFDQPLPNGLKSAYIAYRQLSGGMTVQGKRRPSHVQGPDKP